MSEYVHSQKIRNISQVLHHTMVASTLNFNMGDKKGFKSGEARENKEQKGKNQANAQTSNAAHDHNPNNCNNKAKKNEGKGVQRESLPNRGANVVVPQG